MGRVRPIPNQARRDRIYGTSGTRDSLLVHRSWGRISTDRWREAAVSGELTEVFACGTAAVITPVGHVKGPGGEFMIGDGTPGPVTMRLREELVALQHGTRTDTHGWIRKIA